MNGVEKSSILTARTKEYIILGEGEKIGIEQDLVPSLSSIEFSRPARQVKIYARHSTN